MFFRYRSEGIVINRKDRGEFDRIFTIYTKDFGKLSLLGKSIRKGHSKLCSGMESVALVEVEFIEGKTYKTLTDVRIVKNYQSIKKDLRKISVAGKVLEDINLLIKDQEKDESIWIFFKKYFDILNDFSYHPTFYYYFFWNILSLLGYKPEIYSCILCKRTVREFDKLFFKDGGIICGNCVSFRSISIDINIIKILKLIFEDNKKLLFKLKIGNNEDKLISEFLKKYIVFTGLA